MLTAIALIELVSWTLIIAFFMGASRRPVIVGRPEERPYR